MSQRLLPGILALGLALVSAQAQDAPSNSAVAALAAIPPQYTGQILQLTGDKGTPEPAQWVIYARVRDDDDSSPSTVHTIVVAAGQVISDNPAANLFEVFRNTGYFGAPDIQVDSGDAFLTLTLYATSNNKVVNAISYKLVQSGDGVPIWTLTAFDPNGGEIGWLRILATTGAVIGQKGFPVTPAIPN
ncbi:MAG TPA: hypothetical protein VIS74_00465 [Chthoniobacterales bacterium]